MHRGIWAVKRAHWWSWMKAQKLLRMWGKSGLTPARFDVLFVLEERGKMMQKRLRHVLNVVGSTMSEMLGDLRKKEILPVIELDAMTRGSKAPQLSGVSGKMCRTAK